MNAIDLLSYKIRNYVKHKGWTKFRNIQEHAIKKILTTKENYILSARTSSGKTEAVFLPLISDLNTSEQGLKIIYISPLIALINDQFERVLDLTKELNIPVTKWHGEAKRSAKAKLLKNPSGILLITPESIEAMLVNRPYEAKHLFEQVEAVVIDEIHVFVRTHRGTHLRSLLARLDNDYFIKDVRYFGLSATCGNFFDDLKSYFPNDIETNILIDNNKQERETLIKYYDKEHGNISDNLLKDLFEMTNGKKSLVFPNSRGLVEEASIGLKKISDRSNGSNRYFSHHSSIDKKYREEIEYFAKTRKNESFTICCTSTLELGIDIGSVDQVIQIGSTHTISSLSQRLGRSGRRDGKSKLKFLTRSKWDLVQSIAINELLYQSIIEPLEFNNFPVDILIHQILSTLKEKNGLSKELLEKCIKTNHVFRNINNIEYCSLLSHLEKLELIQYSNREYIIGYEGERLINRKEFYAIFETTEDFSVVHKNKVIGSLPFTIQIRPESNIYLAAKIWSITEVDFKQKKIFVKRAQDGRKPKFDGKGLGRNKLIEDKMIEIVTSEYIPNDLEESSIEGLKEMRKDFSIFEISNSEKERPVVVDGDGLSVFPFGGDIINQTLFVIYSSFLDDTIEWDNDKVALCINTDFKTFISTNERILESSTVLGEKLKEVIIEKLDSYNTSKWSKYLPPELKYKLLLISFFDIEATLNYLEAVRFISYDSQGD